MSKQKTGKTRAAARRGNGKPASRDVRRKVAPKRAAARRKPKAATAVAPVAAAPAATADIFRLKLEPSCTLRDSADLQFSLVAANGDPVVIDGSAVERIDTVGLQLLVALARRQQEAGRKLTWEAASPAVLGGSARLGLNEVLGLGALALEVTP
jgi:ABC-type transporter Mla MlaB component